MWAYEHSVDSGAGAPAIWAVWADVPGWPGWNAGVEKIEIDGPFAPGTRFRMAAPGEETIEMQLADVVQHELFTDVMDAGDFVVTTVHRLEPLTGGGTRVVYRTEITGPAAAEVGPQLGPAITADFPDVLAALVRRAEG
jgi:uncharacterized protein YndB with AHSA1/START domain